MAKEKMMGVRRMAKKALTLVPAGLILTALSCRGERTYAVEVRDGVRFVHNLKPASEKPVAGLVFLRRIGELESKDPNFQFSEPISADGDKAGNLFILDLKDCCVRKFSPSRQYLGRFGRKGQGPGEIEYPMTVDVGANGQVLVSTMSSEFHVFANDGSFVNRFRLPAYRGISPAVLGSDRIVAYAFQPSGENSRNNHVLAIYDFQGKVLHEFGEPYLLDVVRKTWNANFLGVAVNEADETFVAFNYLNRIEKYSPAGKLLLSIDRTLPFEVDHRYEKSSMEIRGKVVPVDEPDFTSVSGGIGVDGNGRIWVLSFRRPVSRSRAPKDYRVQDYVAFEVYDQKGVLLSRLPFPPEVVRFDNFVIRGDRLFFVDPFDEACVYEYAVTAPKN